MRNALVRIAALLAIGCSATSVGTLTQAEDCTCTGTGPGSVPVTVSCGEDACGSDNNTYLCGTDGFAYEHAGCGTVDMSSTDISACSCTGTGPGSVPVTVNCGQSACGSDENTYSCSSSGWAYASAGCSTDMASSECLPCFGSGPEGYVTRYCGQSACGSDNHVYSCGSSGWAYTSTACPDGLFDFDLDNATLASGLTGDRTGDVIYVARSHGSTAVAISGSSIYEQREVASGQWTFYAYANVISDPEDFSAGTEWTYYNSPTYATGFTDPTGASHATKIGDASSTTVASIYSGDHGSYGHDPYSCVWVRDDTSTPPTGTGLIGITDGGLGTGRAYCGWLTTSTLGSGTTWHRECSNFPTSGVAGPPAILLAPSGQAPLLVSYATMDESATGARIFWGAQTFGGPSSAYPAFDAPLVFGSTGSRVITADAGKISSVFDATGNLDVEGSFYPQGTVGSQTGGEVRVITIDTPAGVTQLSINGGTAWYMQFNGGPISGVNAGVPHNVDQLVTWRIWSNLSENSYGSSVRINGAITYVDARTSPSVIPQPTSIHLGSDETGAKVLPAMHTLLRRSGRSTSTVYDAEGVLSGDSTTAAYAGYLSLVASRIYTDAEAKSRPGILSLAVTGERCDQQFAHWLASPARGNPATKWVSIEDGINDVAQDYSAAAIESCLQTFVDDVNTQNPTAAVLLVPMTPVGNVLSPGELAIWYAVNAAIEGGVNAITGSNLHRMPLWGALDNGSGWLIYTMDSGDHVHPNSFARDTVMGPAYRSELVADSLL